MTQSIDCGIFSGTCNSYTSTAHIWNQTARQTIKLVCHLTILQNAQYFFVKIFFNPPQCLNCRSFSSLLQARVPTYQLNGGGGTSFALVPGTFGISGKYNKK